jgi:6-phosphogluconolactonase
MSGKNSGLLNRAEVIVFKDAGELALGAARNIQSIIRQTLSEQDRFSLVLSGGSTPRAIYTLLGQPPLLDHVTWSRVHFFWGDERCVPPDHAYSNYLMAYETLLSHLPLPSQNIHRIQGEILPGEAAGAYEQELAEFFGHKDRLPHLDLVMLGMGEDGHTASLFPGSPALDETERWIVAVEHTQPPTPLVSRISMTLPLLNAARRVALIVSGSNKAGLVRRAISGEKGPSLLPVQRVAPEDGELTWLLDEAAAQTWIG